MISKQANERVCGLRKRNNILKPMGSIAEVTPTDKWNLLQPDEGHFKDKVLANELVSE